MEADDLGALLLQHEVSLPSAHLQKVCSRIETLTSQKAPLKLAQRRVFIQDWVSKTMGVTPRPATAPASSSSAERHTTPPPRSRDAPPTPRSSTRRRSAGEVTRARRRERAGQQSARDGAALGA